MATTTKVRTVEQAGTSVMRLMRELEDLRSNCDEDRFEMFYAGATLFLTAAFGASENEWDRDRVEKTIDEINTLIMVHRNRVAEGRQ